jgi:murein DD-endopeptidase MepM/ murein hydrolase activator NlpD
MRPSRTSRAACGAATALVVLAGVLFAFNSTASAGLGEGLSPTTTFPTDPQALIGDVLGGSTTTSTSSPTSTTSTAPASSVSTTTTTAPSTPSTPTGPATTGPDGAAGAGSSDAPAAAKGTGPSAPSAGSPDDGGSAALASAVTAGDAATAATGVPVGARAGTAAGAVVPPSVGAAPASASAPSSLSVMPGVTSTRTLGFGGRSTSGILVRLSGLSLAPAAMARVLAPFPVSGLARYSADFGAPRHVPQPHVHDGTDIFAARGTPVIASADGVVSRMTIDSAVSGTALRVTTTGGTFFFYAHLDRFVPHLADGDRVARGDVLGFVGTSGNAEGTEPHLHYEIHPLGGAAVDPVPYLDQWLADAAIAAESVQGVPSVSLQLPGSPGGLSRAGASRTDGVWSARGREVAASDASSLGAIDRISVTAIAPGGLFAGLGALVVVLDRGRRRSRRRAQARTR